MVLSELERYRGCLLGLACGDAVGTTVEFCRRGSFAPVTGMTGGGVFNLQAGQWTDDTSMALCLAHSLLYCAGFDPVDQMNRYCNWWNVGYLSSTGECFDIGGTVAAALRRYLDTKDPYAGSLDPAAAGNGALMRLAPVAMYYAADDKALFEYAADSTRTTHATLEAIECSRLFAIALACALRGGDKHSILHSSYPEILSPRVNAIAQGAYLGKDMAAIKGSGYCVESLEAAFWCFQRSDSFEAAVLLAANLGDDADTTAAIVGQLAGAHYGVDAIPPDWLGKVAMGAEITSLADRLLAARLAGATLAAPG